MIYFIFGVIITILAGVIVLLKVTSGRKIDILEKKRSNLLLQLQENIEEIAKLEEERRKASEEAKKIDNPDAAFKFLETLRR